MGLHEHGVHDVVVEFGVFPFDGPRRIDQIHAIAHQRQDPADGRRSERREPHQEPRPSGPPRQAARHEPVFEHHATRHPADRPDTSAEQKGRDGDPLIVGTGRGEPSGEVPFRLGVGLTVIGPRTDGKRLGGWLGNRRHRWIISAVAPNRCFALTAVGKAA